MPRLVPSRLVVCVKNDGYNASLERRKIYMALRDPAAKRLGLLRIVDESHEDYLYPKTLFRGVVLSRSTKKAVLDAS